MTPMYYRGAHAALLVLDVTSQKSFELLKGYVVELLKMVETPILAIASNKADMEVTITMIHEMSRICIQSQRQVSQSEVEKFAHEHGAILFSTSAKTNLGVDELFTEIARLLTARHRAGGAISGSGPKASHQIGSVTIEPRTPEDRESACGC